MSLLYSWEVMCRFLWGQYELDLEKTTIWRVGAELVQVLAAWVQSEAPPTGLSTIVIVTLSRPCSGHQGSLS